MSKTDKKRKNRIVTKSPGTIPAFLLKTYEILENTSYADIISWNKEGNAFVVKKINDFSEKILPKYFKHNNFASFVRQLNMYDFHKARHDNNENEFRHKLFKRGQKHLLADIRRKTSENHQFNEIHQIVPAIKEKEIDKFKKEYSYFAKETLNMKNRQQELENLTKAIFTQNSRLIHENKMLWTELMKNKEKSERKIEKLVYILFHLLNNSKGLNSFNSKKNLTSNAEISKLTNDPSHGTIDIKNDTSNPTNHLLEQNVVSLLSDPNKISAQDQDKLFKSLGKFLHCKSNGDAEYNLNQLIDDFNKGGKSTIFNNYINYLEECEKNNKNLIANLIGSTSNGLNDYDLDSNNNNGINKFSKYNQDNHISNNMGTVTQKRKLRKGKMPRKMQAISNELINPSSNDLEITNEPKKFIKLEPTSMNMLDLGLMQNEEYKIKNEFDNGFMSPNILNSPGPNQFSLLNVSRKDSNYDILGSTPLRQNMFSNQNLLPDSIQDNLSDFNGLDNTNTLMQNNYSSQHHIESKPEYTVSLYPNFKDLQDIFTETHVFQKSMDNYPSLVNNNNLSERKKIDLDEPPGLQTPPIDGFSPAIYVNTQSITNGVGYLSNGEEGPDDYGKHIERDTYNV